MIEKYLILAAIFAGLMIVWGAVKDASRTTANRTRKSSEIDKLKLRVEIERLKLEQEKEKTKRQRYAMKTEIEKNKRLNNENNSDEN